MWPSNVKNCSIFPSCTYYWWKLFYEIIEHWIFIWLNQQIQQSHNYCIHSPTSEYKRNSTKLSASVEVAMDVQLSTREMKQMIWRRRRDCSMNFLSFSQNVPKRASLFPSAVETQILFFLHWKMGTSLCCHGWHGVWNACCPRHGESVCNYTLIWNWSWRCTLLVCWCVDRCEQDVLKCVWMWVCVWKNVSVVWCSELRKLEKGSGPYHQININSKNHTMNHRRKIPTLHRTLFRSTWPMDVCCYFHFCLSSPAWWWWCMVKEGEKEEGEEWGRKGYVKRVNTWWSYWVSLLYNGTSGSQSQHHHLHSTTHYHPRPIALIHSIQKKKDHIHITTSPFFLLPTHSSFINLFLWIHPFLTAKPTPIPSKPCTPFSPPTTPMWYFLI